MRWRDYIVLGGLSVVHLAPHPEWHAIFETLAYAVAFAVYQRERRQEGDIVSDSQRWSVIAAAAGGALLGSRVLGLLDEAPRQRIDWLQLAMPTGGKTIVGGLLGGWIAVELIKKLRRIHSRTGDLFAVPLCIGIAIGRVGCFLAGISDDTYGTATRVAWAVDFGDGVGRHPTQLYEIVFVVGLAFVLERWRRRPHTEGILFRAFMLAYLGWRLLIDFIKPEPVVAGMSAIQWCCLAGLAVVAATWPGRAKEHLKDARIQHSA